MSTAVKMTHLRPAMGLPQLGLIALLSLGLTAGCATEGNQRTLRAEGLDPDTVFQTAANQPPNPRTLYSLARILAAQGRDREASFVLTRLIEQYPAFLPAYAELAELHLRQGDTDAAMDLLARGRNRAPDDPVLLNNIGMCWFLRGEYETALALFEQARSGAPRDQRFRANVAAALGMLGRDAEALEIYDQLLTPREARQNVALLVEARRRRDAPADSAEGQIQKLDRPDAPAEQVTGSGVSSTPPGR